jgi:hypothetical protein
MQSETLVNIMHLIQRAEIALMQVFSFGFGTADKESGRGETQTVDHIIRYKKPPG